MSIFCTTHWFEKLQRINLKEVIFQKKPFSDQCSLFISLKTSENIWLSDRFKGNDWIKRKPSPEMGYVLTLSSGYTPMQMFNVKTS